jgi:hypothetical protein
MPQLAEVLGAQPVERGSVQLGGQYPRSSIRIRLPDGARWRASVPPPAPVPTMITS